MSDHRRHTIMMELLSAIRSPVFSEIALDIGDHELARFPVDPGFFRTLRMVNAIRPFKLVFLLDIRKVHPTDVHRRFTKVLETVTAEGLLDFLDSPPITHIRQVLPRPDNGWDVSFPEFDWDPTSHRLYTTTRTL